MLTSLFSLFYVTGEFHRFLPRGRAVFSCSYVRSFVRSYLRTFVHSYIGTFKRSYTPTFIHSYVSTFVRSFVCLFVFLNRNQCSNVYLNLLYGSILIGWIKS